MNAIRIISVPPGFASERIRREWVGITIRQPSKEEQEGVGRTIRPDSSSRGGYVVRGYDAVQALRDAGKDEAADFWSAPINPPHLVFARECCELIEDVPVTKEHVKVGTLIWYSGRTSMFEWDCPAVITQVYPRKRTFKVRSLDDMREQDQEYNFDPNDGAPDSRLSMRLSNPAEVAAYLKERHVGSKESVTDAERRLATAKAAHQLFEDELQKLSPEVLELLSVPS
ncbi:MAG: hypothetical protein P4M11_09720 [Candidatus Pacebacteria bacterium]|nr:hypothetical protein [Candidatus Paceibacterota bacterium]